MIDSGENIAKRFTIQIAKKNRAGLNAGEIKDKKKTRAQCLGVPAIASPSRRAGGFRGKTGPQFPLDQLKRLKGFGLKVRTRGLAVDAMDIVDEVDLRRRTD